MGKQTYYSVHGHVARGCYTCDRNPCKCDRIEMRAIKRSAKQQWRSEIRDLAAGEER